MIAETIIKQILIDPNFQGNFSVLLDESIIEQFRDVNFQRTNSIEKIEWHYMLKIADLFAMSDDYEIQEKSLRIAQACITSSATSKEQKDWAVYILKKLSNYLAVKLAEERKYIIPNTSLKKHPLNILLEERLKWQSTILTSQGDLLNVNKFQNEFWMVAASNDVVSVSAPTAAGKSYIFCNYLLDLIVSKAAKNILYIVPTRALISQIENDLIALSPVYKAQINYVTIPSDAFVDLTKSNIFIFTQERLHIFLAGTEIDNINFDYVFIDEAHKVSDSYRGILLHHAIRKSTKGNTKIIYASPFSKNPEKLLEWHQDKPLKNKVYSSVATVNQNLFWITQVRRTPQKWTLVRVSDNETELGTITLDNVPSGSLKRTSFLAYTIGQKSSGNLIYANIPSDAEKISIQLKDSLIGSDRTTINPKIADLIELCEKTVHKNFALNEVLKGGVAFHYGNMPQLIRSTVEQLFSSGEIKYLVCTSTLVEGVNMSCSNIFLRGPRKGRMKNKAMTAEDFWNLAGRAGRWGKEFQGNIFCIDAKDTKIWPDGPPRKKQPYYIKSSIERQLNHVDDLIVYMNKKTPRSEYKSNIDNEYMISYLIDEHLHEGLRKTNLISFINDEQMNQLESVIAQVIADFKMPIDLCSRNPGISPYAMQELLEYFDTEIDDIESLLLPHPASDDAVQALTSIFGRINKYLAPDVFGQKGKVYFLARLVTQWMQGYPIARLISEREKNYKDKNTKYQINNLIRDVLDEVETVARFRAPKYVACYIDVLKFFLRSIGKQDIAEGMSDIQTSLEFGVSTKTQLSLIALGLTRNSTIEVADLIASSELNKEECEIWLKNQDFEKYTLPRLIIQEINELKSSLLKKSSNF
jgi:superfamily II DNA/RNA helicase